MADLAALQSMIADPLLRFPPEAYEFLCQALALAQKEAGRLPPADRPPADGDPEGRPFHVSGAELLDGVRDLALQQFGFMAGVVFRQWGVETTAHVGVMVFRLIDAGLWFRSPDDRLEDFADRFDLLAALSDGASIACTDLDDE
ncbi:MAG: Minf_1886 family protein [Planctomycetia bacterium]